MILKNFILKVEMPNLKPIAGGKHTTPAQRQDIINWLKEEDIFNIITGEAALGKKMINVQYTTNDSAYAKLADYINKNHSTKWTKETAKGAYLIYLEHRAI